jgi:nucleotide-binding universal stress UspA family protein
VITLRNILVATDFSPQSEAALAYGRYFARTFAGTLHVIHVTENISARFSADISLVDLPDIQADIDKAAARQLAASMTAEDRTQLHVREIVRRATAPATAITEYAEEAGIDLIVIGTHGRGLMGRFLLGSVAERVVRVAGCPVLVVRNPERDFLAPDALATVSNPP